MVREVGCAVMVGGGVQTSSCVVLVVLRYDAVMCVAVRTATFAGVTVKVALRTPAGTKTLAGMVAAAGLSMLSGTVTPNCVARPRVSVPVDVLPTTTGEGLNVSESIGGRG